VTPRRRDVALDALRLLAVLLMIASHTTRLIAWDERRGWSWFSLLIEPFTASLFLILVGASLVMSWRAARASGRAAWFRKQALRAAGLWAISAVFYALEEGVRRPDVATMSGILATIAYVSLLGMVLVASPRPALALSLAAALCMGAHVWLDKSGLMIFGLNAGNSPLLPLFPLACLGALGVLVLQAGRPARLVVAAAAGVIGAGLVAHYGFSAIFSTPLGRYETARILEWMEHGRMQRKEIPYYNLRPILVPMIASMTVLIYTVFSLLRPALERGQRIFLAMGRRSLDVYILHLAILAVFVEAGNGRRPLQKTWQGDAVVLGAIAASWLWVLGRDAYAARKRNKGQMAAVPEGTVSVRDASG
jgi:uncharacterized membrane protein